MAKNLIQQATSTLEKNTSFLFKKNDDIVVSYLTLRKTIGILGIMLPLISMLFGKVFGNFSLQSSISAYYYTNVGDIFSGLLIAISLFLLTYKGYQKIDNVITSMSGLAGLLIVLFPCSVENVSGRVGLFQLDVKISNVIHLASAFIFFVLLAINSLFLFTKSNPAGQKTQQKKQRNIVYRTSGVILFLCLVSLGFFMWFTSAAFMETFKIILIFEIIMLIAFGASWLVKGEAIFKDRRSKH